MTQHQLVMRTGPTPGKVFELTRDELILGREPGNDIVINDAEISRKHARIALQSGTYVLEDLGSTNGTFVNGQRLMGPHVLRPGELISFGEQITCTYEQIGEQDPNATIISGKGMATMTPAPPPPPPTAPMAQPMPPSQPRPAAATPSPSQPRPVPPPPSYAGKVPAGPEKAAAKPPARAGSSRVVIIVAAVLVFCLLCACVSFFVWVDSDKTGSRWCQYFPFIVNLIGGSCG